LIADDIDTRRLAVAVIQRALVDALSTGRDDRAHFTAVRFLNGGEMLDHWAALANLDAQRIRAAVSNGLLTARRQPGGRGFHIVLHGNDQPEQPTPAASGDTCW
jgi:hypothetical protein